MGHDELCLLSGIRPLGGPRHLVNTHDLDRVVAEMADEIKAISGTTPSDLVSILHESLALTATEDYDSWKPPGLTHSSYVNTCVAIGYFGDEYTDAIRAPGGRDVELRRVSTHNNVLFDYVVTGELGNEKMEKTYSLCSTFNSNPNFFVLERSYRYLEAWLDWDSLPPRSIAFPNDAEPMSIASELYEIVNSREQPRVEEDDPVGILPCISYGGIEKTCQQYQDDFLEARSGSRWTAQGIKEGLRGKDLLPSLMRDFGAWMRMRPDIWPTPSSIAIAECRRFEDALPQGHFHRLPLEILLDIVADCPLSTVVNLSATCHFIRNVLMGTQVLNAILRSAVLSPGGSLRWLLPVGSINGETEQAILAAQEWLTSKHALIDMFGLSLPHQSTDSLLPFIHHSFPFYAFVPACLSVNTTLPSMSTSNRRRFWDIVQQFQAIWWEYRTEGWERGEIFSMFGVEEPHYSDSDESPDID